MEELKQDINEPCTVSDVVMSHAEEDEFSSLGNLSSEVSAIYLAMQQNSSKLECVDEQSQDSISSDECGVEAEEAEDYDDFDPYVFIKDLPDLSMVVPKFRPVLLPKQTRSCPSTTLVLDLDGKYIFPTVLLVPWQVLLLVMIGRNTC
jgi:CTD small phosphatase-like protein 2